MSRRTASRNKPNVLTAKRIHNNQDVSRAPRADRNESLFVRRIGIYPMDRERIVEDAFRVGEGHPVFLEIARSFCGVELETHDLTICIICIHVKGFVAEATDGVAGQ